MVLSFIILFLCPLLIFSYPEIDLFGLSKKSNPGIGGSYIFENFGNKKNLKPRLEGGFYKKDNNTNFFIGIGSKFIKDIKNDIFIQSNHMLQITSIQQMTGNHIALYPVINIGLGVRLNKLSISTMMNVYPSLSISSNERSEGPLFYLNFSFHKNMKNDIN